MNRAVEHWSWFGQTETDVELGVIDSTSEMVFTSGQCHAFALELAAATGWELVGIGWVEGEDPDDPDVPNHVVCEDDTGELWDITGPVDADPHWDTSDARHIDRAEIDSWVGKGYLAPDLTAAQTFVQPWLDSHHGTEVYAS